MDQQFVARIKRRSKYWRQTAPNQWFDVRVVEDKYYRIRGNNNNYRLDDVFIGVRLANGFIVDLGSGILLAGDTACLRYATGAPPSRQCQADLAVARPAPALTGCRRAPIPEQRNRGSVGEARKSSLKSEL